MIMADEIKKSRGRWAGKAVESIEDEILKELTKKPRRTGELAEIGGKDRTAIFRYLQKLKAADKVETDGDYWKVKGTGASAVEAQRFEELTKEKLWQLPVMQEILKGLKNVKKWKQRKARVEGILVGRALPTFKINPQAWRHPETTIQFIEEYRRYYNLAPGEELPHHIRSGLRDMVQIGLNYHISKSEGVKIGAHGKKENIGQNADTKLSDAELEALAEYFRGKGNPELQAYIYFAVETLGRPASVFAAPLHYFQLQSQTLKKLSIPGFAPIYDEQQILMLSLIAQGNPNVKLNIETVTVEYFTGKMWESKTEDMWPKQIRGKNAVAVLKQWQAQRIKEGRKSWFGKEGESDTQWAARINPQLKEAYKAVGLTHEYFYSDPRYALRHAGAHLWLRRTGYDYGAVARMGWNDIATLMLWYGKYDTTTLDAKLGREF